MDDEDRWQVDGGGSVAYQRYLVPMVTAKWAVVLVDRVGLRPGERILDVACGTGAVTRVAAERVGTAGRVAALDINAEMLAVGRSLPPVAGAPIEWHEGSASDLPFPAGTFDAVVCQLGLQFFPDRPAALREMRRVVAATGRVALSVYGPIDHNPATRALAGALDRHVGPGASTVKRSEHALADRDELAGLVAAAGFDDVSVHTDHITVSMDSPAAYVRIQLTGTPLARLFADTPPAKRRRILDAVTADVEAELAPYTDAGGLRFPQEAHHVLAATA
ncbi:MAG TPA: class I SAM-dependent methyltransferase [Micromonosporaceae bacterium]|nr:class I SAM-dependent methyltransferase [Micromonosporaceae bacterium]